MRQKRDVAGPQYESSKLAGYSRPFGAVFLRVALAPYFPFMNAMVDERRLSNRQELSRCARTS